MAFFNDTGLDGFQPKRKFRFTISFTGLGDDLTFMATKADKPSYTIESTQHRFLNHEFKFPNIVKWQDINVSFVDAVDPNVGHKFYNALLNSGYILPKGKDAVFGGGVTKIQSQTLGQVIIRQLDGGYVTLSGNDAGSAPAGNVNPSKVDQWVLSNAFISSVKWGELDYNVDDLVNVDIVLKYDYAQLSINNGMLGGATTAG